MNNNSLVSIVSPVYNGEKYISRFLDSVIGQTYNNIELILINDGSIDKTEAIIMSYKQRFKDRGIDFRYICQENMGQAKAVSQGLKIFTGQYLVWPDSDDILYPDSIEKKVEFLKHHKDCVIVASMGRVVGEQDLTREIGKLRIKHTFETENVFDNLVFENSVYFAPAGFMVRREAVFENIPNGEIYVSQCGQNWQILLPIAYKNKFGFIDEMLFDYIVREASHSRKEKDYEAHIKTTYVHEDCLKKTVESIAMPENEMADLLKRIELKYIKKRYMFSKMFKNKKDARKYYAELKDISNNIFEDILMGIRVQNKFIDNLIKWLYNIKHRKNKGLEQL